MFTTLKKKVAVSFFLTVNLRAGTVSHSVLCFPCLEMCLVHRGTQLLFVDWKDKHPGIVVYNIHSFCLLSVLHIFHLPLQIPSLPLPTLLYTLGLTFKAYVNGLLFPLALGWVESMRSPGRRLEGERVYFFCSFQGGFSYRTLCFLVLVTAPFPYPFGQLF